MSLFTVEERERVRDGLVREAGELGTALEPQLRSISQAR